jgi:hypothetical protein
MTFYLDKRQLSRFRLTWPDYGVPICELETTDPAPVVIDGPAALTLGDASFVGTVVDGGPTTGGTFRYDWRAGAGLWHRDIAARGYQSGQGVLLSTVLQDLPAALREAGYVRVETLSIGVPERRLGPALSHWTRPAGPAWTTLGDTAVPWYVDLAGVTQIRERQGVAVTAEDYTLTDNEPEGSRFYISLTGARLLPWTPGNLVGGRPIRLVEASANEGEPIRLRIELGLEETRPLLDQMIDQRISLARFHGVYEYVVKTRDGFVYGLSPVDTKIGLPSHDHVEIWPGFAGHGADIKPGQSVLLSFIDGNPARPAMSGFMPLHRTGSLPAESRVDADKVALGGALQKVARETDVTIGPAIRVTQNLSTMVAAISFTDRDGRIIIVSFAAGLMTGITAGGPFVPPPSDPLDVTIDEYEIGEPSQGKVFA